MQTPYKNIFSDLQVLVVDDLRFDRNLIVSILKKLGAKKIHIAEDGTIAASKIDTAFTIGKPFDLILSDCKMPGKNGYSLLQWIRGEKKYQELKVIMTTGVSQKSEVEEILNLGVDDFIVKPVTLEVLRKKITELYLGQVEIEVEKTTEAPADLKVSRKGVIHQVKKNVG